MMEKKEVNTEALDQFINKLPRKNKRKLLKYLKQDFTTKLYSKIKL